MQNVYANNTVWFLLYIKKKKQKKTLLWETNAAYDLIYCKQPFFVMVWVFKNRLQQCYPSKTHIWLLVIPVGTARKGCCVPVLCESPLFWCRSCSPLQSTNCHRKVWICQKLFCALFWIFPLQNRSVTPVPSAVSLCVFIIQATTPSWCASQHAEYRAPNLFMCSGEGQANTAASELEELYLSSGPDLFCACTVSPWGCFFFFKEN